jgi:hypothetical protein
LELDDKYVGQLKSIFLIFSIVDAVKWTMVIIGGILSSTGFFLLVQKLTNKTIVALGRNSPEVSPLELETPPRF